ncbi:hypothetical protein T10_2697 [Trichinella papuae]|uniref:Uncharacterized protein n=1 Tax=Trichinella papuae TaxID=268474 RepID=A0A0V1M5Q3_9BILA|nr:hypothetical protein T10_2697 [Trichinella papuae]
MEVKNMNNSKLTFRQFKIERNPVQLIECAFFIHMQECFGIVLFNIDVVVWKVFEYTVESGYSELHGT